MDFVSGHFTFSIFTPEFMATALHFTLLGQFRPSTRPSTSPPYMATILPPPFPTSLHASSSLLTAYHALFLHAGTSQALFPCMHAHVLTMAFPHCLHPPHCTSYCNCNQTKCTCLPHDILCIYFTLYSLHQFSKTLSTASACIRSHQNACSSVHTNTPLCTSLLIRV